MKILAVSDTHGDLRGFEEALNREGRPDMVIHCGDICGDEERLKEYAGCPCHIVRGNMDFSGLLPPECVVEASGISLFACHGHLLGVDFDTSVLAEDAAACGCVIALYGHTHMPDIHKEAGITVMNPGPLSYPRQNPRVKSYGVIEAEKGLFECRIEYL